MARGRRFQKEVEWRQRLARFARAGTSVIEFCLDEGVSTPAFYAWRKRLAGERGSAVPAENTADVFAKRHGPFTAVRVTGAVQDGSQVTVWLRGGTRLQIPLSDPGAAGTVLGALLQADAEQAGGRPC